MFFQQHYFARTQILAHTHTDVCICGTRPFSSDGCVCVRVGSAVSPEFSDLPSGPWNFSSVNEFCCTHVSIAYVVHLTRKLERHLSIFPNCCCCCYCCICHLATTTAKSWENGKSSASGKLICLLLSAGEGNLILCKNNLHLNCVPHAKVGKSGKAAKNGWEMGENW